jgi:hypothetical protein
MPCLLGHGIPASSSSTPSLLFKMSSSTLAGKPVRATGRWVLRPVPHTSHRAISRDRVLPASSIIRSNWRACISCAESWLLCATWRNTQHVRPIQQGPATAIKCKSSARPLQGHDALCEQRPGASGATHVRNHHWRRIAAFSVSTFCFAPGFFRSVLQQLLQRLAEFFASYERRSHELFSQGGCSTKISSLTYDEGKQKQVPRTQASLRS